MGGISRVEQSKNILADHRAHVPKANKNYCYVYRLWASSFGLLLLHKQAYELRCGKTVVGRNSRSCHQRLLLRL
jgi:hypothetical protein